LRSAVLDGLAHSFKTPLATIQSASSGLIEIGKLGDTERELVSLIDEETTRLVKLTNQILQTARLDEGQLVVHHEEISLNELVELHKEQYAALLEDHPLSVIHELGVNYLWADPNMLQMALFQLLDNASKYASPKSPITLRIASTDTEVVFSVQNEGSFIAPEERLRIFQRFYRAPGSQYKASGTGIGLSVTKRIVEAHRGRVWVESDPDTNTTFFLALPHIRKEVLTWMNHKENC
jgi:two-component system sensor histidine kinase KdpD